MAAASNGSEYFEVEIERGRESFARPSNAEAVEADEDELLWAAIARLPSQKRGNFALLRRTPSEHDGADGNRTETIDVRKLDRTNRELVVKKALATNDQDNFALLSAIKERLDRVGLEVPKVEVMFENLNIVADVQTGSRALPTLIKVARDMFEKILTSLRISQPKRYSLTILKDVSGVVKPRRMTLLLGPPGSGKSTLLLALAGKLDKSLKKSGNITYNGQELDEFCVQRTSAYISQTDNHIGELTVRETFDFAARCQGASEGFAGYMNDLTRLEKETNIRPSPEIDAFMKASAVGGKKHSVSTDYVLKVLGLDICSETIVGNDMLRGVSGGQRKRVTTGEMIVGPRKTLFMDEISTGLDSSTTYQIVKCVKNFVHLMEATVLMALLQPAPETFELFDDLMLLAEGHVVYHGPRAEVLEFFESLGFQLPPRKGVADFLQEVTSKKDQAQYWADPSRPYEFIPVSEIAKEFQNSKFGRSVESMLHVPFDKSNDHPSALSKTKFAVSKWELFKTCLAREVLLMCRHRFLYIFRTCQVAFVGFVTCTMFLRTRQHPKDETNGNLYLSCLLLGLVHMMFNGFSELPIMITRLPVFYKQRDNNFHPAWAWSIASWILRVPYSVIEAVVWSCVVYYTVGFAPAAGRFFRFMFLLFSVHQMALGLFRMMASIARDMVIASTFGSAALLVIFLLGGFIIPKGMIKPWWVWAFWLSPLSYGQRAISVNEFSATRWMEKSSFGNNTVGYNVLHSHSLPDGDYWYWLGVGVLLLYALLFNCLVTVALSYLNPAMLYLVCSFITALRKSQTVIPVDDAEGSSVSRNEPPREGSENKGMILPFQPLTMTFHNVNYFVDMPKEMKSKGISEKRLQLLSNVSGVFSPGVLTALVGSSGAGKTTLMDVLAGRKTGGYIEGDIKISGYPKEQRTFARISGYVEQNDIHSPQVTVEESLWFSANLRLPKEVSKDQRREFVEEVMRLVELDTLRHALVGLPGSSGLSTEQRKRLTIAVELVANPSIIFMDEPTSGLDARAAAIVMRTVRNTVDTGRTVVCTIHQPSIDIFEAFDELLLMKRGGRVIYGGKLGVHSQIMINYFEGISGVARIPNNYNPATWMLEVTTPGVEERIGADFAQIYRNSEQYREVEASIKHLSTPLAGSEPLKFASTYAQNNLTQFWTCLWKQNLVYWRSPQYNAMRLVFTTISAVIFGTVFWNVGLRRDSTNALLMVMGALYAACLFLGVNNASSVQPIVSIERTVFYREKAAGMYSPLSYAAAQVSMIIGLVELPYIAVQTIIYGVITYFMIHLERTVRKFFLYLVFMFLTFTYFTYYGMMAVGLTPTQQMAAVISSAFYSLWNLLSGFLVSKPSIPGWWIWFYYICPVAWTLRGIITSQLGDVETKIVGIGFEGTVKEYLEVQLGYGPGMIGVSAVVLIGFSLFFFGILAISVKVLNFQRR
ncbi:ABC_tran domain-containing protein/ABC2_membrane domain-containing protein/PDR_assoc domain-containing protein [Cephalotus follicularis]|uniref:ABC_tran domain-containing protein/ABC2_membrane domain-containing protein/PDR_assoc domain-containing protein n=1 Tax=Cephalotus follicularis TaxID=3775 RepID=A0A1Q3DBT4_CEPFO|nr:ABC_tran domain-containing protein/ABC2_membrane domain-containing protein/PDR_assoc domain-containing protein [Cephalotus follicularis]